MLRKNGPGSPRASDNGQLCHLSRCRQRQARTSRHICRPPAPLAPGCTLAAGDSAGPRIRRACPSSRPTCPLRSERRTGSTSPPSLPASYDHILSRCTDLEQPPLLPYRWYLHWYVLRGNSLPGGGGSDFRGRGELTSGVSQYRMLLSPPPWSTRIRPADSSCLVAFRTPRAVKPVISASVDCDGHAASSGPFTYDARTMNRSLLDGLPVFVKAQRFAHGTAAEPPRWTRPVGPRPSAGWRAESPISGVVAGVDRDIMTFGCCIWL